MSLVSKKFALATGIVVLPAVLVGCTTTPTEEGNIFTRTASRVGGAVTETWDDGKSSVASWKVKDKQKYLIENGCLAPGQADGKVGDITREAVQYFNDANGTSFKFEGLPNSAVKKGVLCTDMAPKAPAVK